LTTFSRAVRSKPQAARTQTVIRNTNNISLPPTKLISCLEPVSLAGGRSACHGVDTLLRLLSTAPR
jgi:hypothetical protein